MNDLLQTADNNLASLLLLLDLSAAFDTINHSLLLNCLEKYVGTQGTVPSWFQSYLSNRTQFVNYSNTISGYSSINFGVPQESVLGPMLFSIYMLPLGDIIRKYDICFHCYADYSQLYIQANHNDNSQVFNLEVCLLEVKNLMCMNFPMLNADKKQVSSCEATRHKNLTEEISVNIVVCTITESPVLEISRLF